METQLGSTTINVQPNAPVATPPATASTGNPATVTNPGNATGGFAPATPINVDTLGQTPSAPINLPPTTPYTPPVLNVNAPAGTTVGANGTATVPPATTSSATAQVQNLIGQLGTEGNVQNSLETAAGTDKLLAQSTADYNAYTQAKIDQTNTIAQMRQNAGGTTAGSEAAIAKYQLESDAHISNLAVQSQISSGNYTDAENTITKKVDAMFTPIKDQITALGSLATMENNDMTDSEKEAATEKAATLQKESDAVQAASHDIQSTLLKNGTYAQVAPKIDQINQDYVNGKIDAATAQSEMYAAASKYSTVGTSTSGLSNAEISSGAVKAGVSETAFKALPADVQSFYSRASSTQLKAANDIISGVQDGSIDPSDASDQIDALQATDAVKAYLKQQVTSNTPADSSGGGGFMGFLGGLWNKITGGGMPKVPTGTDTSTSTVMTGPDGTQYTVPNDKVATFKANGFK